MLKIVVIKLAAPKIEEAPAKCRENIERYDFDLIHEASKLNTGGTPADVFMFAQNEVSLLLFVGSEALEACRAGWRKQLDACARIAEIVRSGQRKWSDY